MAIFRARRDGTELIVYDPAQLKKGKNVEVERFTFPAHTH